MSAFKTGHLATPVKTVKTSPRLVLEAQRGWQGPFERVFAKVLPVNGRCIESVCAWIVREVELPAPEPMLLNMHISKLPKGATWLFGNDDQALVFATRAIENARPLLQLDTAGSHRLLDKWPALAAAAVFDQLVANDDRTAGNILVAPQGDLWLIDHARSLGGGGERLFSTDVMPMFENFFLNRIAGYPMTQRAKLRPALMTACMRLASVVPRVPYEGLQIPEEIAMQIDNFLQRRLVSLQAMVHTAIGLPDLYDVGDSPRATQ